MPKYIRQICPVTKSSLKYSIDLFGISIKVGLGYFGLKLQQCVPVLCLDRLSSKIRVCRSLIAKNPDSWAVCGLVWRGLVARITFFAQLEINLICLKLSFGTIEDPSRFSLEQATCLIVGKERAQLNQTKQREDEDDTLVILAINQYSLFRRI